MLTGKHVVLRAIEPSDLADYVRWFADTDVLEYFGRYRPRILGQERAWYDQK